MERPEPCCTVLRDRSTLGCGVHTDPLDCADVLVVWSDYHGAYGLPVRDGGTSRVTIVFCPWCGARLPGDL